MEHDELKLVNDKKAIGLSFEEVGIFLVCTYVMMDNGFVMETGVIKKYVVGLGELLKAKNDIITMLSQFHNCNILSETT